MGVFEAVVIALYLVTVVLMIFMFFRAWRVSRYRTSLIKTISKISKERINKGREDWESIWDEFEALPSYSEMAWKFWRPLDSFLTDEFKKELAK